MKTGNIINKVTNMFLALLMSFSLVYALTTSLNFTCKYSEILITLFCVLSACFLIFYSKTSMKVSAAVIGIPVVLIVVLLFYNRALGEVTDSFVSLFTWVVGYINESEPLYKSFQLYLLVVICIFTGLTVYFLTVKRFGFYILLVCGTAIFIIQWIFNLMVSRVPFYLYMVFILTYYFRHIYNRNSKISPNEYVSPAAFALWALPLCTLVVFIGLQIPDKEKPIEWPWLDKKIIVVFNKNGIGSSKHRVFDYFSLSATGFSSKNKILGGKVKLDKTMVLRVDSPRRVYLKGSISNIYTGSSWESSDENLYSTLNSQNYINTDYYEMMSNPIGLPNTLGIEPESFIDEDTISITFKNLKTKSLFIPIKTEQLNELSDKNLRVFTSIHGIAASDNAMSTDFSYEVSTASVKYDSEEFKEIIRQSRRGFYDDEISKLNSSFDMLARKYDEYVDSYGEQALESNELRPYDEHVKNNRDRVLGSVAIKTKDRVFLIIAGLSSREDNLSIDFRNSIVQEFERNDFINSGTFNEKVEIYIANNKKEFLNLKKFALDNSKLLNFSNKARNVYLSYLQLNDDMPLRVKELAQSITDSYINDYDRVKAIEQYLSQNYKYTLSPKATPKDRDFVDYFLFDLKQGYCTYYASAMTVLVRSLGIPARYVEGYVLPSRPKLGSIYEVTNENAHAWVEVYFEGFGWVPFEPTSSFSSVLYSGSTGTSGAGYSPSADFYMEQYMKQFQQSPSKPSSANIAVPDTVDDEDEDEPVNKSFTTVIVFALCVFAALLFIAINQIRNKLKLNKALNMPPRESILSLYKHYIECLMLNKLDITPGETPLAFSERVDSYMLFSAVSFKAITETFLLARYSTLNLTEKDRQLVYDFHKQLVDTVRKEMGKIRFFVYRYLLGRI